MRCPKCGFISYDLLETCIKCGKNINAAAKELHGTVASIPPPPFLRFEQPEPGSEVTQGGESEAEMTFDLGGNDEALIDLGAEESPSLEAEGLDLGGAAAEPAFDLGLGGEPAAEPVFAEPAGETQEEGFMISDLAPAQEGGEEAAEVGGEPEVAEELEFAAAEPSPAKAEAGTPGLADLKVEGIDLESAPAKGKTMPSVKTGTALDEFDIDLGDLIPKKK
ncbi:MAG: hypothetical protein C4563_08285 [Desulfobulbus sp.]|nr:MAG: hypothetical protein C4563_08285 [Desulfobulbus sp.]